MRNLEKLIQGIVIVDVIGQDHLQRIHNYGIERDVICLQRQGQPIIAHPKVLYLVNDLCFVSSSRIKQQLKKKKSNFPLLESVAKYISQNQLYQ